MDEIEFRKRVYANPVAPEQEVLDAARANPDYQKILDQTHAMDQRVDAVVKGIAVPDGLRSKLLEIPAQSAETTSNLGNIALSPAANSSFFHYYAVAASLLLMLGITFSIGSSDVPSATDLAFGDYVFAHLHSEPEELAVVPSLNVGMTPAILVPGSVNEVMADTGVRLASNTARLLMDVYSAKPCVILPAYQSAHLVLQGEQGPVSVIVINNSPVQVEYQIRDQRFNGLVVPANEGNMILVGEQGENLEQLKQMVTDSMEWVI